LIIDLNKYWLNDWFKEILIYYDILFIYNSYLLKYIQFCLIFLLLSIHNIFLEFENNLILLHIELCHRKKKKLISK